MLASNAKDQLVIERISWTSNLCLDEDNLWKLKYVEPQMGTLN